ncbi:hypothetical protein V6N13_076558 [Hibiscus sabdariffa]
MSHQDTQLKLDGAQSSNGASNLPPTLFCRNYDVFGPKPSSAMEESFTEKNDTLPSLKQLSDARVIYAAAPALGHNKEAHPESSARVPAIVTALDKMELTSKFRGSDILELQNFNPASVDDIASVHAKAYVYGLEKAMDQASEQGLIVIDGSGPTYATSTTFHESLVAAGAGLALVDSVVMSQLRTLQLQRTN